MAKPSFQVVASWVLSEAIASDWRPLREVVAEVLAVHLRSQSEDEIADLVEEYQSSVEEQVRNELSTSVVHGRTTFLEIDTDNPYVRRLNDDLSARREALCALDWKRFEELCSEILIRLGGQAKTVGASNDGGVDFYAIGLEKHACGLPLPTCARLAVVGQAKRHVAHNVISEVALRGFVGGAMLQIARLRASGIVTATGPVCLAFWTSSSFEPRARNFANELGIWLMDGATMAHYVRDLKLDHFLA